VFPWAAAVKSFFLWHTQQSKLHMSRKAITHKFMHYGTSTEVQWLQLDKLKFKQATVVHT